MRYLEAKALRRAIDNKALQPVEADKSAPPAEVDATDRARTLAAEHGLDLAGVSGSGSGGRVTVADVEAALEARG